MSVVLPAPKNPVTIVNGVFAEPSGASEEEAIAVDGGASASASSTVAGWTLDKLEASRLLQSSNYVERAARAAPARRATSRVLVGDSLLRAARA
jgi:hypothetical protein